MDDNKKVTINDNMRNTCFFCSKPIVDKKSQEHIIPDSLLGKLGIKEEKIIGKGIFQYSRIKVPAHKSCNSEFGSKYEDRILKMLDGPEELIATLKAEESTISIAYGPDESTTSIFSTWLTKIYYGLFYNNFLKVDDIETKEIAKMLIDTDNFRMMQNAYKDGVGFCLPSSLYVFQSNKDFFDLQTFVYPQTIMMKINKLIFILAIQDGFLTKNYLNSNTLERFRQHLTAEEKNNNNFPTQLFALAEVLALRMCIPKIPSFVYSDEKIINLSLSSNVNNPKEYYKVDEELIEKNRNEILLELNVKLL